MDERSGVIQRVAELGVLEVQEPNLRQSGLLWPIDDILRMVVAQDENRMCPVEAVQVFAQLRCNGRRDVWAAIPLQGNLSSLRHRLLKIGSDLRRWRLLVQLVQSVEAQLVERVFELWGGVGDIKKQLIAEIFQKDQPKRVVCGINLRRR